MAFNVVSAAGVDKSMMSFTDGNAAINTMLDVNGITNINANTTINGNLNIITGTNKIVGFGDPINYYIGYYPVEGSAGFDVHSYGGIRFGDRTEM